MEAVKTTVDITLAPLFELNAEINSQIGAIKRGIDDTLSILPIDILFGGIL